jgi:endo-beta-N-acetylglucosaminidase D
MSQIAEKYSALRFWYWRLRLLLVYVDLSSGKGILLVSVLPSVNTEEGLELADDGVLVL